MSEFQHAIDAYKALELIEFHSGSHIALGGLLSNVLQNLIYNAFFIDMIELHQFKIVLTPAGHKEDVSF